MLYNQPYGVSDPNAPYINGNPSTGTMGSIPPAASIEYPQREIVNLITDAEMTPTNSDLHQLAKAIQSGALIYEDDTGVVNQVALNCTPQVMALQKGMIFISEIAVTNTGPSTATVNGLTAPIVHPRDGSPLLAFDLNKGQMVALAFDGANFQLAWAGSGQKTAQGVLQANYDFYVDPVIGDDTLYDGTQPTVGSAGHGPFKTIPVAITAASKLNANGYTITIHCANGTYTTPVSVTNVTNGGLVLKGNPSSPASCVINTNVAGGGGTACVTVRGTGVNLQIDGFKLINSYNAPGYYCLVSQTNASVMFQNIDFGFCGTAHILCDGGQALAGPVGNYTISGNCSYHIIAQYSAFYLTPSGYNTVSIIGGALLGTAFAYVTGVGFLRINTRTNFVGGYAGGAKYQVLTNGVIDTGGAGPNFLPGATAGSVVTGGQYV
jgi:hypothetical protein